jgi:hypothetical protein
LEYVFDTYTSVTAANNSYDLILARRKMIADSRITWKRWHVKGHQYIPMDKLDTWGRVNDYCDMDAKSFWATCRQHHRTPKSISIYNGPWSIWSEDQMVAANMMKVLYHNMHSPKNQARWRDRGWLSSETFDLVDWTALEQAAKAVPATR